MGGWWQVVFWLLLIPLIVIEIIVFLKSRKFFWLVFALAIFAYVIAVSYTIDVFNLGRNAVMLILLASAVLMFLVGKQLGRKVKKQRKVPIGQRNLAIALCAIIVIVFTVSVIFGKLSDTVKPVQSIKATELIQSYEESGYAKPIPSVQQQGITVLTRTLANSFILPIPVPQKEYRACLVTNATVFDLGIANNYLGADEEVAEGATKTITIGVMPYNAAKNEHVTPVEVSIYETPQNTNSYVYAPCAEMTSPPAYSIPVV